jgi:hypothetical protein
MKAERVDSIVWPIMIVFGVLALIACGFLAFVSPDGGRNPAPATTTHAPR